MRTDTPTCLLLRLRQAQAGAVRAVHEAREPELAMVGLSIDPGQRFSLERKLDPGGRLRILHSAAWRNYLVVTVGWALSRVHRAVDDEGNREATEAPRRLVSR